jgi:hypothetical protein
MLLLPIRINPAINDADAPVGGAGKGQIMGDNDYRFAHPPG